MKNYFICLLFGFIFFSCNKDIEEKIGDTIIKDNVTVVSKNQDNKLEKVEENILIFSDTIQVKPNEILVSGVTEKAPYGYLRKVVSSKFASNIGKFIVVTEEAKLTDVIEYGKVSIKRTISPQDTVIRSDIFSATFDLNLIPEVTATSGIEANITGSLDYGMDFLCDINIENSHLEYFKIGIETSLETSFMAELTGLVQLQPDSFEHKLFEYPLQPFTFFIGGVPLVFVPNIYGKLGIEGSTEGSITSTITNISTSQCYAEYCSGWNFVKEGISNSSEAELSTSVALNLSTYFKLGLKAELYGLEDNFGKVEAKLSLDGKCSCSTSNCGTNCEYDIELYAKGKAGIELGVLDWNIANFYFSTPKEKIATLISGHWPKGCEKEIADLNFWPVNMFANGVELNNLFYSISSENGNYDPINNLLEYSIFKNQYNQRENKINGSGIQILNKADGNSYLYQPKYFGYLNKYYLLYREIEGGPYVMSYFNITTNTWIKVGNLPNIFSEGFGLNSYWNWKIGGKDYIYINYTLNNGSKIIRYSISDNTWEIVNNGNYHVIFAGEDVVYLTDGDVIYSYIKATNTITVLEGSSYGMAGWGVMYNVVMKENVLYLITDIEVLKFDFEKDQWVFVFSRPTLPYVWDDENEFLTKTQNVRNDKIYVNYLYSTPDVGKVKVREIEIF